MMRVVNPEHPADRLLLDFKAELRSALGPHRHDVDQVELSDVCMIDASLVSRWTSRSARDVPAPQHYALMARRWPGLVRDLVSWIVGHAGYELAARPRAVEGARLAELLASVHRESNEFVQALIGVATGLGPAPSAEHLDDLDREAADVERVVREVRQAIELERRRRASSTPLVPLRAVGSGG